FRWTDPTGWTALPPVPIWWDAPNPSEDIVADVCHNLRNTPATTNLTVARISDDTASVAWVRPEVPGAQSILVAGPNQALQEVGIVPRLTSSYIIGGLAARVGYRLGVQACLGVC